MKADIEKQYKTFDPKQKRGLDQYLVIKVAYECQCIDDDRLAVWFNVYKNNPEVLPYLIEEQNRRNINRRDKPIYFT